MIKKNKKIIGYGATAKSCTVLNYCNIDYKKINYFYDTTSFKINHYLPGTRIPILPEEIIFKKKPDYLLILSWHISKEIINNLKRRGFKGKFIVPLPKVKILS